MPLGEIVFSTEDKVVEKGIEGRFDYLEHKSDVYVVAYGSNVIELFENAGLALFHSMVDLDSLNPAIAREVEAEGFDLENALYMWLEKLLILYYAENILCREVIVEKFVVERVGEELSYRVKGLCRGEFFDKNRHVGKVEVKAVTYSLMRIIKLENNWKAYFVLDI